MRIQLGQGRLGRVPGNIRLWAFGPALYHHSRRHTGNRVDDRVNFDIHRMGYKAGAKMKIAGPFDQVGLLQ